MSIKSILLLDEISSNNSVINDTNNLIIVFNEVEHMNSFPFISIESEIKRSCLHKPIILNNIIHILHNNLYDYKITLLKLPTGNKLPVIYIIENNIHIFITSYNDNVNRLQQSMNLNMYTDSFSISKLETILICGYFGYNFYTNPSEVSLLSDELYSDIPLIYDDNNNTKLNRYVFIRKYGHKRTAELIYENNICKYKL